MLIREATPRDWPAIWAFMRPIVAAGETYSWDRDIAEDDARAAWLHEPPGRTLVAVDTGQDGVGDHGDGDGDGGGDHDGGERDGGEGTVLGTAELQPNHGGPASHVANAGFMVDPAHAGRGVGRALARHVIERARAEGYRAIQFNAVVETNANAVHLWRSLGFEVLTTVPEAFHHPTMGYVGLHIMYLRL